MSGTIRDNDEGQGGEDILFPIDASSWSEPFDGDLSFNTAHHNRGDNDDDEEDGLSYDFAVDPIQENDTTAENKNRTNTRTQFATNDDHVESGRRSKYTNTHIAAFESNEDREREEMQPIISYLEKKFEAKLSHVNKEITTLKEQLKEVEENSKNSIHAIESEFQQQVVQLQDNHNSNSMVHTNLGYTSLTEDTYALMMIQNEFNFAWLFSFIIFTIQLTLLIIIFQTQISFSVGTSVFDVPFNVSPSVRAGQFLAIVIAVLFSNDVVMPIKDLSILWFSNQASWSRLVLVSEHHDQRAIKYLWFWHILFPNILKLSEGMLVLIVTQIIIIQTGDIIDLFKDFAATQLIAELDNVSFHLANHGYFGSALKQDTEVTKSVRVSDEVPKACFGLPLRPMLLLLILSTMIGGFIPIIAGQVSNSFFHEIYPNCPIKPEDIYRLGNGMCENGIMNSFQCGFDHGDCIKFNIAFPQCNELNAWQVGDGECQESLNKENCGYDGGDCCPIDYDDQYLQDGKCHAGFYNTKSCRYNNGGCDKFQARFQFCPDVFRNITKKDGSPVEIGDGICDFVPEYMNEECNYEGGDCVACQVDNANVTQLGNGVCDAAQNTEGCNFDNGDCIEFNENYPMCNVPDPSLINNNVCNGGEYNTLECGYDGNDCISFNKYFPNCTADEPSRIGDDNCDTDYDIEQCGYDGGDCANSRGKYPNCSLDKAMQFFLGDGRCTSEFSSKECGFDGGDCASPKNDKFCGSTYVDATKCGSFACPTGENKECPDGQICFKDITCDNVFYCGTSWKDANDCGKACPTGNDNECDGNQICIGGITSCTSNEDNMNYCGSNWLEAKNTCGIEKQCPRGVDSECENGQRCYSDITCSTTAPIQSPSISATVAPVKSPSVSTNMNYCGNTWLEAKNTCGIEKQCPKGVNSECGNGQRCYSDITCSNTAPVQSPSISATVAPVKSPSVSTNMNYCGNTWLEAKNTCRTGTACPGGGSGECPEGQTCYAGITCS